MQLPDQFTRTFPDNVPATDISSTTFFITVHSMSNPCNEKFK